MYVLHEIFISIETYLCNIYAFINKKKVTKKKKKMIKTINEVFSTFTNDSVYFQVKGLYYSIFINNEKI